jgi:hypothetical protein
MAWAALPPSRAWASCLHEQHITGGGAASAKHPSFLVVNTILGNLKTALAGTHHSFGFQKYAHRYLAQVQYLFNRRFDMRAVVLDSVHRHDAPSLRDSTSMLSGHWLIA